ncbi:MAG: ATP-binding protein [Saprospiraceae bacterium]|jgi:serine/threonine-protein kinase RsbW|nr:ATP-binding protein [Saprospiraceae bacterium]MBL0027201.1 ATP-binding protein [Saprospiraceae bacterium]
MLSISSNPNNILELESYLKKLDFDYSFESEKFADILISLTEAVNNAIIHGNQGDESKFVHIHVSEIRNGISFCVTDEGRGFNPGRVPDPTSADNIECCGGRGVFIMKALSDDITFADNGRTVEMYFNLKNQMA